MLSRGVKKGDKVAILLMNCIEWLPIYFGILKTGALAVPLNFRYTADEISYCLALSDATVLVFGPEFTGRVEQTMDTLGAIRHFFFVGNDTPTFSDNFSHYITYCSSTAPAIEVVERDDAAIYFSSGTTGFPKAILHSHESLMAACIAEQKHPQPNQGRCICLHSPAVSYRREDALVRQPDGRRKGDLVARYQFQMGFAGGVG